MSNSLLTPKRLKAKLEDLEHPKRRRLTYAFIMVFSIATVALSYLLIIHYSYEAKMQLSSFLFALFISIVLGGMGILLAAIISEIKKSQLRQEILKYDTDTVKEQVEENVFENSVKLSYKYLDQYYQQTRDHAHRGFFVTIFVAVFGAVLIFAGIVAMFFGKTDPSYITCASGVLTEFIAAIFFYLYNKTVASMSNYHNKLVLSQNISIALKIAESLPSEDRTKSINNIISELLKDVNLHLVTVDTNPNKEDSTTKSQDIN